jgi:glycosyltransferase involved in cell wall biosynthesis
MDGIAARAGFRHATKPSRAQVRIMGMSGCDVVIPCRDEAAALPIVLNDVPEGWNVIVVDNGSTDDTADVARRLGAQVVTEPNPGYGSAVHAGVLAATAEYVAVIDGDASMRLDELVPMLRLVHSGAVTMAVGRRRPVERGVWPWHARLGTKLLATLLRRGSSFPIHDLAPMRVCRRDDLLALDVQDRPAGTKSKVSGSVVGTAKVVHDFAKVLR